VRLPSAPCWACKLTYSSRGQRITVFTKDSKKVEIMLCSICWNRLLKTIINRYSDDIIEELMQMCGMKFNPSSRIIWRKESEKGKGKKV